MEENDVVKLADILRENGTEVLSGQCKLVLSLDSLNNVTNQFGPLLNNQQDVMSSSFQVIHTNHRNMEYSDIQFLHNMLPCVVNLKLKLTNNTSEITDITIFKNLKHLELNRVNVSLIIGLQGLRMQLQSLVCIRGASSLDEILEKCGADDSAGFTWSDLKQAAFIHSQITEIDNSLMLAPLLHTLDLSHNEIDNATPLNYLTNLRNLNLGFNKLISVPTFSGQICNRLQVLVLRNNFIEDIMEIIALSNLQELDLSNNCLFEFNSLFPLGNLVTLQVVNLMGNPHSYHPQHRTWAARYLHSNAATTHFILNGEVLSKNERRLVGSLHPRVTLRFPNIPSTEVSESVGEKPRKIREVTISEGAEAEEKLSKSEEFSSSFLTSGEHLETKRKIEMLREMHGENWLLQNESGSVVQDVLGMEKTPIPICSTPCGSMDFIIKNIQQPSSTTTVDTCPINDNRKDLDKSEKTSDRSEIYVTAPETVQSDHSLYTEVSEEFQEDDDLAEGEESIYLATRKGEDEEIFIVITHTHILEKDNTNSFEKARWPIGSLISCEMNENVVSLYFDTIRNDKNERSYVLDFEESQRLGIALSAIIAVRPPEPFIQFNCLKCSTQFTTKKDQKAQKIPCPNCKSSLVFEEGGNN